MRRHTGSPHRLLGCYRLMQHTCIYFASYHEKVLAPPLQSKTPQTPLHRMAHDVAGHAGGGVYHDYVDFIFLA